MRTLVIDTATEALSVALYEGDTVLESHHEIVGRGHAERLVPIIATLPDGGRARRILVDGGPGSFTGVRVGLSAARALAYAWGAELHGYTTLALVAAMARTLEQAHAPNDTAPLAIVLTGGHGELFWQMFDRTTLSPLTEPTSTPVADLARRLAAPRLYGTGAAALVAARGSGEAIPLHPDARHIALLPPQALQPDALPLYGRGADAVPLADRKRRSPCPPC